MKALGSIAEVERELRAEGFFEGGAAGLVADVYLGYGLSRGLRRTSAPDPPEPCALPPAAVRVRSSPSRVTERVPGLIVRRSAHSALEATRE